jgi:hypothetical protein
MAWSYALALATDKDKVRLLIGDTVAADPQLADEEITFLLAQRNGDLYSAAADACDTLQAKYARQADTSNLSLSVSASQRAEAFATLAATLRVRALTMTGAEMFVGGTTVSGKDALDADSDAVQPNFRIGQNDEPGTVAAPTDPRTL